MRDPPHQVGKAPEGNRWLASDNPTGQATWSPRDWVSWLAPELSMWVSAHACASPPASDHQIDIKLEMIKNIINAEWRTAFAAVQRQQHDMSFQGQQIDSKLEMLRNAINTE